jgi:hypothetical protein
MTADIFAERLLSLTPSAGQLSSAGLSVDYVQRLLASYRCIPKNEPTMAYDGPEGAIFELVRRYDLSRVRIAMISFGASIEISGANWLIGNCEADLLVVDSITGEILVEEHATDHHILWECAENGGKFLEALLIVREFLGRCRFDEKLYNDSDAALAVANQCVVVAGGERYRAFFHMICGCF